MLNIMRDIKGHWLLKLLMIIVAASMTLYLGSFFFDDSSTAAGSDWVAKVAGREIGVREFQRTAQNLDSQYRSMFGDQYDQIKPQLRLGSQALAQLLEREIVLLEAHETGVVASKKEVAAAIQTHPSLQGAGGNFVGKDNYLRAMERYPGGVAGFERTIADNIVARKWRVLATESAFVNESELENAYRVRSEKTAIEYVLVRSDDQDIATALTGDDIRAWYDAHSDDYLRDTARKIRYAVLSRQDQLANVEITDGDIETFYDENRDAYSHPAQRRARHILLKVDPGAGDDGDAAVRAEAETTIKRLLSGTDFAEIARAISQDPGSRTTGGDLGWFGRGRMVPEFESAVFSGTLIPTPVKTAFGYHVIRVEDERDDGFAPIDEVRDDIRRQLAARKAQELLRVEADRIAGRIESADQFAAVATDEGLEVFEATVRPGDGLPELAPSPEFRDAVHAMDAGAVRGPLGVARGLAIVAVDEVVPASVAPLEEVENEVRTAVLSQRTRDAAVAAAERALGRHGDLAKAAKALGTEVRESGDLAPGPVNLPGSGGNAVGLRNALFADDLAEGDTGVVEVPAGAVAFRVTRRIPFDAELFAASRDTLRVELLEQKRSELLRTILMRLEQRLGIEVKNEIVSRYDS